MNKRKKTKLDSTRRGFIRNVLTVVGATLTFWTARKAMAEEAPAIKSDAEEQPASKGYQETEHVRSYYKTVRF